MISSIKMLKTKATLAIEAEGHYVNLHSGFLNMVSNAPLSHLLPTYTLVCTCTRDTFPAWYCVDIQMEW